MLEFVWLKDSERMDGIITRIAILCQFCPFCAGNHTVSILWILKGCQPKVRRIKQRASRYSVSLYPSWEGSSLHISYNKWGEFCLCSSEPFCQYHGVFFYSVFFWRSRYVLVACLFATCLLQERLLSSREMANLPWRRKDQVNGFFEAKAMASLDGY